LKEIRQAHIGECLRSKAGKTRESRKRERWYAEHADGKHRPFHLRLPAHEPSERERADRERRRGDAARAFTRKRTQTRDQQRKAERARERTRNVKPAIVTIVVRQRAVERDVRDAEWDVNRVDPRPRCYGEDEAAERRTGSGTRCDDRCIDAECAAQLGARKDFTIEGGRDRKNGRCAEA